MKRFNSAEASIEKELIRNYKLTEVFTRIFCFDSATICELKVLLDALPKEQTDAKAFCEEQREPEGCQLKAKKPAGNIIHGIRSFFRFVAKGRDSDFEKDIKDMAIAIAQDEMLYSIYHQMLQLSSGRIQMVNSFLDMRKAAEMRKLYKELDIYSG